MIDQYFGTKELYEVALKARTDMVFGSRKVKKGEPILYFENINMAILNEQSNPIAARGGWGNTPRVIWEDRSEVTFTLSEGVMTSISLGILASANMLEKKYRDIIFVPKKEQYLEITNSNKIYLSEKPSIDKPIFCYTYEKDVIQERQEIVEIGENYIKIENGDINKQYLVDYYFAYGAEAIIYLIEKERFNGTFTLEGKFYTKDENEGINVTNILTMPKVRVMSNINLRLGERADPTVAVFNIIAMPEMTDLSRELIIDITRLSTDIDAEI